MKNLRGLFVFVLFLLAIPTFAAFDAFLKLDGVRGESTAPGHQGWMDLASFSWGMYTGPVTTAARQSCATNEIHFTVRAANPALLKIVGQRLQPVSLDVNGQHHVLEGATLTSCQGTNCVMRFQRCSVHAAATSNASMLVPAVNRVVIGGQGSDATIIAVHPAGANAVTLKLRGGSSLAQSCATGQHIRQVVITCRKAGGTQQEFMTFTLNDALISSYQATVDGSVLIGMKFASHEGIVPEMQ